jgi:hypothetical protein
MPMYEDAQEPMPMYMDVQEPMSSSTQMNAQERMGSPTQVDAQAPMDSPFEMDVQEPVSSPTQMDAQERMGSPTQMDAQEPMDSPIDMDVQATPVTNATPVPSRSFGLETSSQSFVLDTPTPATRIPLLGELRNYSPPAGASLDRVFVATARLQPAFARPAVQSTNFGEEFVMTDADNAEFLNDFAGYFDDSEISEDDDSMMSEDDDTGDESEDSAMSEDDDAEYPEDSAMTDDEEDVPLSSLVTGDVGMRNLDGDMNTESDDEEEEDDDEDDEDMDADTDEEYWRELFDSRPFT